MPAVEVNIRRVVERVRGERLADRAAEAAMVEIGAPLRGRDRLLALMDVGALLCRPRDPRCAECPLRRRCATARCPLDGEARPPAHVRGHRSASGAARSWPACGRAGAASPTLDAEALDSLVADGLADVTRGTARLP